MESPQKKSGTTWIPGGNSSDKGKSFNDPISGKGKDRQTSTHYDHSNHPVEKSKGGQKIEGQNLRGYVFNDGRGTGSTPTDATVAADGTRRVKTSD